MKKKVDIGSGLKAARSHLNLSQEELAGILGVTRNTVINWESNRNQPDLDMLVQLCKILHISIHDLFPEDSILTPSEWSLIKVYRTMMPKTQELAHSVMFSMMEKDQSIRMSQLRETFKVVPLEAGSLSAGTAGNGNIFVESQAVPFFLRISDRTAQADAVIQVSGRSMEPVYHDGDYIYFQRTDAARAGEDVVVAWAGEQYVKRVNEAGKLFSVNPDYPFLYEGSGDDIRILGRVLGIVSSADRARQEDLPVLEEIFRNEVASMENEAETT